MKKILLTQEKISNIIDKYLKGISSEKIAIEYNLSGSYICRLLKDNNIKVKGNKKDIDVSKIVGLYKSGEFTMSDICKMFNVSKHKILSVLKENNIELKTSKKYNYNNDIFENIDTEEKAYWLGFLYADGYVRERKKVGSELRLKLSIVDKEHLIKFKGFISEDDIPLIYEEYRNSKSCKVSINSKKIVSDLINKGCINKKSKIIEFPNFMDNSLISHFIRGYFDGDGSISYSDKQIGLNFVSGSENFLKKVASILESSTNCKNANLVGSSKNYKYIQFSAKEDLYRLYDYLYMNSTIFMERKKVKYTFIINNFTKLKEKINMGRTIRKNNKSCDTNKSNLQ